MTCAFSSANNFALAQTLYRMRSLCRSSMVIWLYSWMYEHWSILCRVNIGVLTGWKKIKQWRISFVLGYLRMILWKISTAISIKHRILATFNIKKKIIPTALNIVYLHQSKTVQIKKILLFRLPIVAYTCSQMFVLCDANNQWLDEWLKSPTSLKLGQEKKYLCVH